MMHMYIYVYKQSCIVASLSQVQFHLQITVLITVKMHLQRISHDLLIVLTYPSLRSVGTTMHFQIEFTFPGAQFRWIMVFNRWIKGLGWWVHHSMLWKVKESLIHVHVKYNSQDATESTQMLLQHCRLTHIISFTIQSDECTWSQSAYFGRPSTLAIRFRSCSILSLWEKSS